MKMIPLVLLFGVIAVSAVITFILVGKKGGNTIATIALSLFIAISSILSNKNLSDSRVEQDKAIYQYTISNQNYTDFLKSYNQARELFALMDKKYKSKIVESWQFEDQAKYNKVITDFNVAMSQMYVALPDEEYGKFIGDLKMGERGIQDYGEDILVAMRRANNPETKYDKREDIRMLFYK